MTNGLAITLVIVIGALAALLSAGVIVYSIIRSRVLTGELRGEIGKLKKALEDPATYLDGLPETKERRKNIILYSALKLYKDNECGKAIAALEDALLSAMDDNERCSILNLVGLCQVKNGAVQDAQETFLEMITTAERNELDEALAPALGNIGNIYSTLGELREALGFLQKALEIDEKTGKLKGQARDLCNIGNVYFALAEQKKVFEYYQRALEYHQKALKIDEEINYSEGQARELGNIGAYYLAIGDSRKGLDYYERALEIAEEINNPELQFNQLNGLGIIHKTLARHEEALGYFEKALKIAEHKGSPETKVGTLANIGALLGDMGDNKRALAYFQKAREIYVKIGAKDKIAVCESNIARARQKLAEQNPPSPS